MTARKPPEGHAKRGPKPKPESEQRVVIYARVKPQVAACIKAQASSAAFIERTIEETKEFTGVVWYVKNEEAYRTWMMRGPFDHRQTADAIMEELWANANSRQRELWCLSVVSEKIKKPKRKRKAAE